MSHHHQHASRTRRLPEPTIKDQLWGTQQRLHDIARHLDHPGPHGAQYASDIYDILGALKVASRDVAVILERATGLLTHASDHGLTSRACTPTDRVWLERAHMHARQLVMALENAQTSINDIGGYLTATECPE